jgi:diguanylate cyclase (GGDEF)-like protein
MSNGTATALNRTFLAGKIISNYGQSSIDCTVRRLSTEGATIEVESVSGLPEHFHLLIVKEGKPRECKRVWQSNRELGLTFQTAPALLSAKVSEPTTGGGGGEALVRSELFALRAALDEIHVGVLLLDSDLKSHFINRAFRQMWQLADAVADRNPAFVALMYHGRDTNAYQTPTVDLDEYIAERVRLVRVGNAAPLDLRRSDGRVFRMQCAILPDGGRMITYTNITDIVKHSDELEVLRAGVENLQDGILLMDTNLNVQFMNRKVREYWKISELDAAERPSFASLLSSAGRAGVPGLPPSQSRAFCAERIAAVKAGEHTRDIQAPDGRRIRARCTPLEGGGRMLTYCDITDLTKIAEQLETLATIDSMTGLYNRRHFMASAEAEWGRFQRYQRPLTMLMIDIDHFKSVNDRYGHAAGDKVIAAVSEACLTRKRKSDIVGRLGGEEFAVLLPETNVAQARIVAERIRRRIAAMKLQEHDVHFKVTASIGLAEASADMSGVDALFRSSDQALYWAKDNGRNCLFEWTARAESLETAGHQIDGAIGG